MKTLPLPKSLLLLFGLGLIAVISVRADVNSDLAFSNFSDVDVNSLAGGKVMQKSSGLLIFPRAITTQALYILDADPKVVQDKLVHWDPKAHPELKVWLHQQLPLKPTPADFTGLSHLPENSSVQYQIDATAKLDPDKPALQLTKGEVQLIKSASSGDPRALFANVWSQILAGRITHFLDGQGGEDHFAIDGGEIDPLSELKSLLHCDPKVYGQFQRMLAQTPAKTSAKSVIKAAPVSVYCDMFDVQGYAALGTGAVYQAMSGSSIQSADLEFYINSGVYSTIELEQLWPIAVNGKTETLVWRSDLVAAPNVAYLHGTERLASGMIMQQDVKEAIDAFRAEFK